MPRRDYPLRIRCAEPGSCREGITYRYETRREYTAGVKSNRDRPWKCDKHRNPDAYLKPGNESTRCVLTASRIPARSRPGEWLDGLFWIPEGDMSGSGYTHGPGFVARTAEFPEGTRLVVTTQILLPEATDD